MTPNAYKISVQKIIVDEELFFEATVHELPDVREYGENHQKAYQLALDTISTAASMYAEQGRKFPVPEIRPGDGFSGRVTLRLPKSLHRHATVLSEMEGVSLNQLLVAAIAEKVGAETVFSKLESKLDDYQALFSTYFEKKYYQTNITGCFLINPNLDWKKEASSTHSWVGFGDLSGVSQLATVSTHPADPYKIFPVLCSQDELEGTPR